MNQEGLTLDITDLFKEYAPVYYNKLGKQALESFTVDAGIDDPEGIAFRSSSNHLFLVSTPNKAIYELDLFGTVVREYDISSNNGFNPEPRQPQGLAFAPSSNPYDDPNKFNIYIADGRARIYEAEIPNGVYTPVPDIAVNPSYHNFGQITTGAGISHIFEVGITVREI